MLLLNSSIVYAFQGNAINSIVLNELIDEKIIPDKFKTKIKINSSPFPTIINLEQGYSIHNNLNKIIIQISYPEEHNLNELESLPDILPEIANNYKRLLKLDCIALGINFKVLIFSKEYKLSPEITALKSDVLELKYQIQKEDFVIINSLNKLNIKKKVRIENGIIFDSNFHFELESKENKDKYLESLFLKRNEFLNNLKEIINGTFSKND